MLYLESKIMYLSPKKTRFYTDIYNRRIGSTNTPMLRLDNSWTAVI
jgi:hypothetical protein